MLTYCSGTKGVDTTNHSWSAMTNANTALRRKIQAFGISTVSDNSAHHAADMLKKSAASKGTRQFILELQESFQLPTNFAQQ